MRHASQTHGAKGRLAGTVIGLVLAILLAAAPAAWADGATPPPKASPAPEAAPAPKAEAAPAAPNPAEPAQPQKATPDDGRSATKTQATVGVPTTSSPHPRKIRVRARDVYFGHYRAFHRPAVLDTQKVFDAISFYQELKGDGLTKKSGRYWILMQKSNRIFYKALKRLSAEQGYDLIGARNAITIDGTPPVDVTGTLLAIIPTITLD